MKKAAVRKRTNIKGINGRYRISVFRSNKNIFAQIIDDEKKHTLVAASSLKMKNGSNVEAAKQVGKELAEKAKAHHIVKVVFDRGRYLYLGRIKALAEAARANGLEF